MSHKRCNCSSRRIASYLLFSLAFFFFAPSFNLSASQDVTAISEDIQQIFPSATRVGSQDKKIPITPVFQLGQLLGFVFESNDFTNFLGFSGQTINLLIGLDTKGVFTGLKVITHNEPIFLHGLGEQSMFDFVDQYQGHSLKERFIINARDKSSNEATYFNGVTKATISVLVINDTIIASALKVAREKLEGFVAPSRFAIKTDFFEELNFEQLLQQGYVHKWTLTSEEALNIAEKHSEELVNEIIEINENSEVDNDDAKLIDLYYAFVNIPIIGKNLLGDAEYQRLLESLKPGEHALMMFSRGAYSFVGEEFVPQTVPSRLSAEQDSIPVDIRDIDFYSYYDPSFNINIPEFEQVKVLRIKSQSGFELNKMLSMSLALNFNQSFLTKQQFLFNQTSTLPKSLFTEQVQNDELNEQKPLWVKIWISRVNEIILLGLYLSIIIFIFLKQERISRNEKMTHQIRFLSLLFIIGFVGFYTQGQLSVVNIYTLLLAFVDGFQIEVFLLDPIIFILWVFVFISLFLWGRGLFCGWLCPFGAIQEVLGIMAKKLKIKQININAKHHQFGQKIKYVILILLVGCSLYSLRLAEQLAEVEPFKTSITLVFVRYWPFVLYSVLLLLIGLKIHKFYCRYLCPLGAGLAIVGRYPIFKWLRRRPECGSPCQLCRNKKCDIDAINQDGSIDYNECIQCLECLVTIENPTICAIDISQAKKINAKGLNQTLGKNVGDNPSKNVATVARFQL